MKADAHHQAALDIEQTIADLGNPAAKPYICRTIIEDYWGASFQWVAYGGDHKHGRHKDMGDTRTWATQGHGRHKEKHQGLAKFLRDLGEPAVAQAWEGLETVRAGGWYGASPTLENVDKARQYWQEIRAWALS